MIMASLEAQRSLELAILDYMSKRGFHRTSEAFSNEIRTNQNLVAINSTHEAFLQAWWGKFYEAYNFRFPDFPVFDVKSFDKVVQSVNNVVGDNCPANQSYASDLTGANVSTVMPESSSPDIMDPGLSALLSSFDASYLSLDLSPQRDMTSGLHLPEMSEMGDMLPLASNAGYQMQQMPTVPAEWNARVDIPGANLGGPMRMEPNLHAATNALPDLPELSDAGNNRSLQQASHQGWPSVDVGSVPPVISHQAVCPSVIVPTRKEQFPRSTSFAQQNVLPSVAVQTWDKLRLLAPASSGDLFCMLTLTDSSVKDAGMLGETNLRIPENLPADQQIGGIMRRSGKQPVVQEHRNQLGLQSSNKSGIKRKTPLSSLEPVGKEKTTVASFAAPARTRAEWKGNSLKAISNLHTKTSKLLCCHFNSEGELLAAAGHDKKVLIWQLGTNNVYSGEGHAHHVTDIRFRPHSTVFATSSFDRTVKIWDAAKPSNPFQNLVGHVEHVMSTDFHPTKLGLLSSCDTSNDIRLWDVSSGECKLIFKHPKKVTRHVKDIRSMCWHMSGKYLASVSEDSARIWSASDGKCLYELCSGGNKFQSCTFHPEYVQVLVIGSFEFLEMWNPFCQSSITQSCSAHTDIITSLAGSPLDGTIASKVEAEAKRWWRRRGRGDPEEISTYDPPERPEDFIEPASFDDGPMESEEEIAKAYEELYGAAYSGETFLGNDIYAMDSKVKKTTSFGKTKKEKAKDGFDERVVQVRRVTKVVKGGKQLHFRAVVVVGDKKGQVGVGVGKAKEVIAAVQKSAVNARRNLITVPMTKYLTFPHRSDGDFGAARVMLRPAAPGTGVIAGGAVRIVLEMAGVENALGKQLGSNNALNNARATVVAVQQMRQFSEVAQERGIPMEELWK
ncbi:hypothetical protein KY290_016324 [Solanum tuberosum]|uniref:S5 DRBM domain-containing protein n=1 Tax=Solanum tuberosum TaxID=4113 RepID=A0ABQ7VV52_SOLTU|nr:hypothetical protein KY290_016324 [Solanum tuberosum]